VKKDFHEKGCLLSSVVVCLLPFKGALIVRQLLPDRTIMKIILLLISFVFALSPVALYGSDREVFLNAFGETATAYLNDSCLLLGTTADGFVADILPRETAVEIARNVQKRVRVIRAKLKAVSASPIATVDKQLIGLLDKAYACMDHQAWALYQYVEEKSPETAKRFDEQRTTCQERIKGIAEFYSVLPPSPELPEPLSTR